MNMTERQELSYRKQIARQLRKQYVEGIYRLYKLLWMNDLEMYVKGHSRSLETEPLDRSYTTDYY